MKKLDLSQLREHYTLGGLLESQANADPMVQFGLWMDEAIKSEIPEPNAMALGTVAESGYPEVRVVLLKEANELGFVFYTNYKSDKARQMAAHPQVSLTFLWKMLQRQVRILGTVSKLNEEQSAAYFDTRPTGSKIGAWVSPQSEVIAGREYLEQRLQQVEQQYQDVAIPKPPHWGGYMVVPSSIEFWQGRPSRLHDRLRYTQRDGEWVMEMLAP